jgi:clan AA aspartic protease (TIGR02281 family)
MARIGIFFFSLFLLGAFHPLHSSATIYKWIDSGGTVHFSDNFDDVPPAYRNEIKVITEPHRLDAGAAISFDRTNVGLILVEAVLNGRVKAKMVFDTGANLVVITEELAKKLNQDPSSGDEVIKLHTNCGEVEGRSFVIQKIELEGAGKGNVRSVITPDTDALKGFDGLLGLSFLGDFKIAIDYQNGKILLSK